LYKKELNLESKSMYTYLFEKVSDLESRLTRTVFYYLYEKYDNSNFRDLFFISIFI
jgi:hypothetical protein